MTPSIATLEPDPPIVALDHFAGTGWAVACHWLGILEFGVEIMREAIRTRSKVGFRTVYRDVWAGLEHAWLVPFHDLYIASPPCQTFSVAGRGTGRKALDMVLMLIASGAWKDPGKLRAAGAELGDDRTALVLSPLAHIWAHRPRLIALEQVPTVLPVWEAVAEVLRGLGYSVWTGNLSHDPKRLDAGVEKWVSMAEALGWGMTARPYPTIATGTEAGGTDPAALGGSGARKNVYAERAAGRWAPSGDADNDRDGGILRLQAADASTLQTFPRIEMRDEIAEWRWVDAPATTVAGDPRITAREHHFHGEQAGTSLKLEPAEAARFQTFPSPFPFQGTRGKQFLQIGNAVPPLLAYAILGALIAPLAASSPAVEHATDWDAVFADFPPERTLA